MKIYTPKRKNKEKKVTQYQFLLMYEETKRKTHNRVARPVTEHLVSQRSANLWRVFL
jgi:hypothetical protein